MLKHGKTIKAELLDSGYLSREMTDEIEKSNAKPYIKMKKNSTTQSKGSPSWRRNIRFQKDQPDEFMKEYCYRVVIEGIISALKKMFGSVISFKEETPSECGGIMQACIVELYTLKQEEK